MQLLLPLLHQFVLQGHKQTPQMSALAATCCSRCQHWQQLAVLKTALVLGITCTDELVYWLRNSTCSGNMHQPAAAGTVEPG
jgi:hypothetical protein